MKIFDYKDFIKIKEYLKDDVEMVVIEKDYVDKDYEILSITFTRKSLLNTQVELFHFFKEKFPPEDIFNLDKYNDKYIGYSIIRPTRINSIGRTIIDPCAHSKISGVFV